MDDVCDDATGKCRCKLGFEGDKCEICPDGAVLELNGDGTSTNSCPSDSTKGKNVQYLPIHVCKHMRYTDNILITL